MDNSFTNVGYFLCFALLLLAKQLFRHPPLCMAKRQQNPHILASWGEKMQNLAAL